MGCGSNSVEYCWSTTKNQLIQYIVGLVCKVKLATVVVVFF